MRRVELGEGFSMKAVGNQVSLLARLAGFKRNRNGLKSSSEGYLLAVVNVLPIGPICNQSRVVALSLWSVHIDTEHTPIPFQGNGDIFHKNQTVFVIHKGFADISNFVGHYEQKKFLLAEIRKVDWYNLKSPDIATVIL